MLNKKVDNRPVPSKEVNTAEASPRIKALVELSIIKEIT